MFSFDADGKLVRKATRDYGPLDSAGNWTVEINSYWETRDKKLVLLSKKRTIRTITYFDGASDKK